MLIVETTDRLGNRKEHRMSGELNDREAMERLGVYRGPFTVVIWPEGRPDQARTVQTHSAGPDGNITTTRV